MNNIEFNFDNNMSMPAWKNDHSESNQLDLNAGVQFSTWTKPNSTEPSSSMHCEIKIVQSTYRNLDKRLKVTVHYGSAPYILLLNLNTKAKTFIEILNHSIPQDEHVKIEADTLGFSSRDYIEIIDDQISLLTLINVMQFKPFIFIQNQLNEISGIFSFQIEQGELSSDLERKMLITETTYLMNEFCLINKGISFADLKNSLLEDNLFITLLSGSNEVNSILSKESLNQLTKTLSGIFYKVNRYQLANLTDQELTGLKETCIFFRMLKEISN